LLRRFTPRNDRKLYLVAASLRSRKAGVEIFKSNLENKTKKKVYGLLF